MQKKYIFKIETEAKVFDQDFDEIQREKRKEF